MIRILSNTYSEAEKQAIHEAMCFARAKFLDKYCGTRSCEICRHRHICYDLDKATDFTNELRRGETDEPQ